MTVSRRKFLVGAAATVAAATLPPPLVSRTIVAPGAVQYRQEFVAAFERRLCVVLHPNQMWLAPHFGSGVEIIESRPILTSGKVHSRM